MKKLICIVASCLMVAALSTSCTKTCTCKTYAAGVVMTTSEIELDNGTYNKCSDMNTYIEAASTGIKCE